MATQKKTISVTVAYSRDPKAGDIETLQWIYATHYAAQISFDANWSIQVVDSD
jgi:hypothetical protein